MNSLTPTHIIITVCLYFALLYIISYYTSRKTTETTFFNGDKSSPWILVAFGMIGATLSGVTFISIPGVVGAGGLNMAYSYMQMVFGYLVGYFIIATVLMPIYYKYNLLTIYGFLEKRLGFYSYKTAAAFFVLSRLIGASFRLFLVSMVLHLFITGPMGIPFWCIVVVTLALIWIYTFKGGIKTIVWTDAIQTTFMLLAVGLTITYILSDLGLSASDIPATLQEFDLDKMFFFENGWNDPNNFFKQFISGAFIALVMTGLDQDMMQKNLTCKTLPEAQKNMYLFSVILVFAKLLFLTLGAMLYIFASKNGIDIPERTDQLYPIIALNHLPPLVGIIFIIGIIAAAYSSADSALTSLTTSFCVDFLNFEKSEDKSNHQKTRLLVHVGFTVVIFVIILIFNSLDGTAVINKLFEWAGYTYGPILGLFSFAILTKMDIKDKYVIPIAIITPIIAYIVNANSETWFGGLKLGFMIIVLTGLLCFIGLFLISKPKEKEA